MFSCRDEAGKMSTVYGCQNLYKNTNEHHLFHSNLYDIK